MYNLSSISLHCASCVRWPYMGHAEPSYVPIMSNCFLLLYFDIFSSPGAVTLDVIAQSQTLWMAPPKLVTNEALPEMMSNISGLFLITLYIPLLHPQTPMSVCSFAWPLLEKKLVWLHCRVQGSCIRICGGTDLSLCVNDPCQALGTWAGIRLMLMKCTSTVSLRWVMYMW